MKNFKTMSELEILRATYTTILEYWSRHRKLVEQYPDNEIAKFHMQRYWAMLEELNPEIIRLEREAKKYERECYEA